MLQYSDGFVSIDGNNKTELTGFDTLFMQNAKKGDLIVFDPELSVVYTIQKVNSNTSITLSSNYAGNFLNKKIKYSITRLFSSLFDLPVTQYMDKGFSSIVTLKLRMLDVLMKNLGFRSPDGPICISSLQVFIRPEEATIAGALFDIYQDEKAIAENCKSGFTKVVDSGYYEISINEINGFARQTNKTVFVNKSDQKIVYMNYLKMGDLATVNEAIIIYNHVIKNSKKRIAPKTVRITFAEGDSVAIPSHGIAFYLGTLSFNIICSYIIDQNIIDNPLSYLFETDQKLSEFGYLSILKTDQIYTDNFIAIKPVHFKRVIDSITTYFSILNSVKKIGIYNTYIKYNLSIGYSISSSIKKQGIIKSDIKDNINVGFSIVSSIKKESIVIP